MKTIAFHTLGCKLNYSETSAIARKCVEKGFLCKNFDEKADVYILNTCSVTENADREARFLIRQALRRNPEARIVMMGCYAQLKGEEICDSLPVDLLLGTKEKFRLPELLEELKHREKKLIYHGGIQEAREFQIASSYGERTRAFLKIQDGCDYPCTYCTIPLARGKSRSARPEEILKEINALEQQGIREIVLTGVNTGDYGILDPGSRKSMHFYDLLCLLEEKTRHIRRIRISSIEPNLLSNDIIRLVAASEKLMPHFHVPLQSGCNEILSKMKRRYRRELYAEKIHRIHQYIPMACIGTDVMVGFPGESEEHFNETFTFLESLNVSYLHIFTYSPRPGTEAYSMQNQIPEFIKKQRNKKLRRLSMEKSSCFYKSCSGQVRPVLVEKVENGNAAGFTDNYIRTVVPVNHHPIEPNQIIPVRLEKVQTEKSENTVMKGVFSESEKPVS